MQYLRSQNGKGKLTVVQSSVLDDIVNNVQRNVVVQLDSLQRLPGEMAKPQKMMGYRIQIYAGPKATGQQVAKQYERRCKEKLPGISTYVRFVQPRWTCRIGDFQNREDAQLFLEKVNEANISKQATIVRCEIFKVY